MSAAIQDELAIDPGLSLTWLQMTVKRLEDTIRDKDKDIRQLKLKLKEADAERDRLNRQIGGLKVPNHESLQVQRFVASDSLNPESVPAIAQ